LKARQAEVEALKSALYIAVNQLKDQQNISLSLENEIALLNQAAENMRSDFKTAADTPTINETSSSEAKSLFTTLEKTHGMHNQLKDCKEKIDEIRTDIEYIRYHYVYANKQLTKLEKIQPLIQDRVQATNDFFGIEPEPVKDDANTQTSIDLPAVSENQSVEPIEEARPSAGSLIWSYFKIIVAAMLLAFVIRAYVFDVTQVDGLSMYPTLDNGDDLINSEISYLFNEPKRGDIVVFDAPDSAGEDYVKRIIGLPNEEIVIDGGLVYINGDLLDETYLDGIYTEGKIRTVIPDGFYFVMGDNREISRDSRSQDVGLISIDQIHGKAVFRIYPFNSIGSI
jgi:signal peptidase I